MNTTQAALIKLAQVRLVIPSILLQRAFQKAAADTSVSWWNGLLGTNPNGDRLAAQAKQHSAAMGYDKFEQPHLDTNASEQENTDFFLDYENWPDYERPSYYDWGHVYVEPQNKRREEFENMAKQFGEMYIYPR